MNWLQANYFLKLARAFCQNKNPYYFAFIGEDFLWMLSMEPPPKPSDSDCCNSGCNPCILDVYEAKLRKYKELKARGKINVSKAQNCMSKTSYSVFRVITVEPLSSDTNLYSFEYLRSLHGATSARELTLRYSPGQHFLLKVGDGDNQFTRAYTPISRSSDASLRFSVIIKLYETGRMSQSVKAFRVGFETLWRGPYGNYTVSYNYKYMICVAQGTGIAPIYSVLREMLNNEDCETIFTLCFCCRKASEILLRDELCEFSAFWNFSYRVFVSDADGFQARYKEPVVVQRLSKEELEDLLAAKVDDVHVLICGSKAFSEGMMENVRRCGVVESKVFVF